MNNKILLAITSLLMAVGTLVCAAGDGEALYKSKGCVTCHGADANTPIMALYPKLAGQNKAYLLRQMKDIGSGERDNSMSKSMRPVMHALSDQEMNDIAKWLSSFKGVRAMFKEKGCAKCHGEDGNKPKMNLYPKLACQGEAYLFQQMKDIGSGARDNSMAPSMQPVVHTLSQEEMKIIAGWLSNASPECGAD